jgi:hypothetical protein
MSTDQNVRQSTVNEWVAKISSQINEYPTQLFAPLIAAIDRKNAELAQRRHAQDHAASTDQNVDPALSRAAKLRAHIQTQHWPSVAQLEALMLDRIEYDLRELAQYSLDDCDYSDTDPDIDQAIAMALLHVQRLRQAQLSGDAFTAQWQMVASTMRLCSATFSRPDHLIGRSLNGVAQRCAELDDLHQWHRLQANR